MNFVLMVKHDDGKWYIAVQKNTREELQPIISAMNKQNPRAAWQICDMTTKYGPRAVVSAEVQA